MTEKDCIRRAEIYADAKLAYVALKLCYPFSLENLQGEIWKWIKNFEEEYQISNYGRSKSFKQRAEGKILTPSIDTGGYLYINLWRDCKAKTRTIHRLVAETFIPNPLNLPEVNHIFGNKFDNYFENLEWCTSSENQKHAYKLGLRKPVCGENCIGAKFNNEQVKLIRKIYIPGDSEFGLTGLAEKFHVSKNIIFDIVNFKTYKNT